MTFRTSELVVARAVELRMGDVVYFDDQRSAVYSEASISFTDTLSHGIVQEVRLYVVDSRIMVPGGPSSTARVSIDDLTGVWRVDRFDPKVGLRRIL